ncbi:Cytochrome c-552 [uncultured archaeon]|nr:Cytochrome c-552 [uncultured archaeon]
MKRKLLLLAAALISLYIVIIPASALNEKCAGCHPVQVNNLTASRHSTLICDTCHEGTTGHLKDTKNQAMNPAVHFDMEICKGCHPDQYSSFLKDVPGKTFYKGSLNPPSVWPKTLDFPYWNAIIDGHPFVLETYENRPMMYNQIDAQNTIRPKSESCLVCHGTKVAYYMGINGAVNYPAREITIKNTQNITQAIAIGHDPATLTITVPAGTKVSTYTDTLNQPLHQVKTVVKLPDGRIYTSFDYPGATATGVDSNLTKAKEARNWIWATLEAMAFDGLDQVKNKPSIDAGVLCNMCHDPHNARLRLIQKPLIWSIAQRGINPYSRSGSQVKDFSKATRQDKIIAICAQCHVEYVGGYSAVDRIDRNFWPWGKVGEIETMYTNLFDYNQDWIHGTGVSPWQNINPGARGYYPGNALYPINISLIKSQHPEAEVFWNSVMYNATCMGMSRMQNGGMMREGATCKDCHAPGIMNPAGKKYTSHWFASPVKYIKSGGINPCARCHMNQPVSARLQDIKNIQDEIFDLQNETQIALFDAQKAISQSRAAGKNVDKEVQDYRKALVRWEYYAQAENSMGFHNRNEVKKELNNSLNISRGIVTSLARK